MKNIRKLLVPNRGEIAIRVFRSATELGLRTVALYSYEDRFSLHRYKADEAYQVGSQGSPVQSYLNIDEVIRVCRLAGADAIHPGYGFLSERADLHRAAKENGIIFVGPSEETLELAGNKVETLKLAKRLCVPTVPGSGSLESFEDLSSFSQQVGFPVIIKAQLGGGGRGMRVVRDKKELERAYEEAANEANAAFGSRALYAEKFVTRPKHIEVQLLGDGSEVLHLFERDCSVQRRHQKLVECAPSISLKTEICEQLYEYALALGRELKLRSLATAEFLVGEKGEIYFIEINPRVQVEHTVTEEITGIDLIRCQLEIADGQDFSDMRLRQDSVHPDGVAIQCRITTEDPANEFQPDYGKLVTYRSAAGFGIRLDAGSAHMGGAVLPYYDSLLVKVTARARSMEEATSRLRRSLSEFRIRGVKTNIAFLEKVLSNEQFLKGECRTSFLDENPGLFRLTSRRDRANKLLRFIAEAVVNGHEQMIGLERPDCEKQPRIEFTDYTSVGLPVSQREAYPKGWRDKLQELGKAEFLQEVRAEERLLITDTTFRDAHQSLLATRLRTYDMLPAARALSYDAPGLFSLEMWGGATFDVCLRFLREDPWERLAQLRAAVPNILFQMLIRGSNVVGYKGYPNNVVEAFVKEAHAAGIDIFRIFDCFNNLSQMRTAIDAVKDSGIAEVCICYTGDLLEEEEKSKTGNGKFNLKYYLGLAKDFEAAGADIIAIKDMAGLLRAPAARMLVRELRKETDLPIHLHTHDTAGVQASSYRTASNAGVDIVDCAFASMSGLTSQPSLEGIVASFQNTDRDTELDLEKLSRFSNYWESVRPFYKPFESDLRAATGEVYLNEIPGGQYSNFRPQAASLGLGDRWSELKHAYAQVNQLLGGLIKVTPSSKVVGDFAIFMVSNDLTIDQVRERAGELNFPASVIEFFRGELGIPHGGIPASLQQAVLRGEPPIEGRPSDNLSPADFDVATDEASALLKSQASVRDALSLLLYPHVFKEFAESRVKFSNLSILPTLSYFYGLEEGEEIIVDLEPGKRLFITLVAISEPGESGERTVFFELNGYPRHISVRDNLLAPAEAGNEKADVDNENHVGAPLSGAIVQIAVAAGDEVKQDQTLFTIEAMKMQTVVASPRDGKVKNVAISSGTRVEVGDLVVEFA